MTRRQPFAKLPLAFLLVSGGTAALAAPAGLSVTAGDVTDRRRNDGSFSALEVELKLSGEAAAGARGARATVQKAVDDTGRNLLKEGGKGTDFEKSMGDAPPSVKLDLKNPARRATKLKEVSGRVEVFSPNRDPAAVARVDRFQSSMDRPISAPALKASGTGVTVVSRKTYEAEKKRDEERRKKEAESAGIAGAMANAFAGLFQGLFGDIGENDVLVKVDDESKKVFGVDVFDASGKQIDGMGSMKIGDFWILKFSEKLPADASLRIYLLTPKSLVTAPFNLKDVALP